MGEKLHSEKDIAVYQLYAMAERIAVEDENHYRRTVLSDEEEPITELPNVAIMDEHILSTAWGLGLTLDKFKIWLEGRSPAQAIEQIQFLEDRIDDDILEFIKENMPYLIEFCDLYREAYA